MTTTPDTIDALTADLTEDDAWKILFAMARKFHWIPCVWSMGDVLVSDDEDPDDEYCASDLAEPLTEAERSTVAATWEWRKGINDYASQQVADMEMIPHVVRHYRDGEQVGFTVRTGYDGAVRYDMDGNEDMDGHEDEDED